MCGLKARKATGERDETPSMSRLRRAPRLRRGLRLLPRLRPYIVKHRCPGHCHLSSIGVQGGYSSSIGVQGADAARPSIAVQSTIDVRYWLRRPGRLFIKHRCPGHRCPPHRPEHNRRALLAAGNSLRGQPPTSPAVRWSRTRRCRLPDAPIQASRSRRGRDTRPISPVPLTLPLDTV